MYLLIFSVLYFKNMISIVHMSLRQHYNKIIFIFVVFRMLEMRSCRNLSIECAMSTLLAICSWYNSENADWIVINHCIV